MTALIPILLAALGTAATLDDKGHAGLHLAEQNPAHAPPPVLFTEADIAQLKAGQSVFVYQHIKGHDLAVAAVTSWADKHEIWRQVRLVQEYPKVLTALTMAKTVSETSKDDFDEIKVALDMEVPVPVPGRVDLTGRFYKDQRYLVFSQDPAEKKEKRALEHAVGYWQVTPFEEDKVLVVLMVDVLPSFPVPVPARQMIGEQVLPTLVWNLCRTAEASINERERALLETE